MSDYATPPAKRTRTSRSELLREPREELVERCLKLQNHVENLSLNTQKLQNEDFAQLKEMNEKLMLQFKESSQREGILVMRLTAKEQEVQDLLTQLHDMKEARCPGSSQLQSLLLDPAVNLLFESFKKELETSKTQLKQAQDDLAAFKFTPDSHIGKRLMAKCRLLLNENEELGRAISSGSVAKLESTIAMEKKLIQDMKKAEKETEYLIYEIDEDMEGLQATVYQLQQDLKESRSQLRLTQEECKRLRAALPSGTNVPLEASGNSQVVSDNTNVSQAKRSDLNSDKAGQVKRTMSSSNAKPKSRHLDKKDTSTERTNYKSSSRNRGSGLHGNQEQAARTAKGGRTGHVRQYDISDSKTGGNAVVASESSNGGRHGSVEKPETVASETSAGSAEKSRSASERDNQKQRMGSKTDAAGSELANGLVCKHSALTDVCQKV